MAQAGVRAVHEQEAAQPGKRPFDLAVSDYFRGRNCWMSHRENDIFQLFYG